MVMKTNGWIDRQLHYKTLQYQLLLSTVYLAGKIYKLQIHVIINHYQQ